MHLENAIIRTYADEKDGINIGTAEPYLAQIDTKLRKQGFAMTRAAPCLDLKVNVYKNPEKKVTVMHQFTFIFPSETRNMKKHGNFYIVMGPEPAVNEVMGLLRDHRRVLGYKRNAFLEKIFDDS